MNALDILPFRFYLSLPLHIWCKILLECNSLYPTPPALCKFLTTGVFGYSNQCSIPITHRPLALVVLCWHGGGGDHWEEGMSQRPHCIVQGPGSGQMDRAGDSILGEARAQAKAQGSSPSSVACSR